jgi:hypothetical protein
MSLADRDWYRAELAKRERRRAFCMVGALGAVVLAAMMILPIVVTPVCNRDVWRTSAGACWRDGWSALVDRIGGNMAASRG